MGRGLIARTFGFGFERDYLLRGKRVSWSTFRSVGLLAPDHAGADRWDRILRAIYRHHGGEVVRLREFCEELRPAWQEHLQDPGWLEQHLEADGYYYGRLGPFHLTSRLPDLHYVSIVRDPRDILVWEYFAREGIDPAAPAEAGNLVGAGGDAALDAYVLDRKNWERVEQEISQPERLAEDPSAMVRRHEDLTADPKRFMLDAALFMTGHEARTIVEDLHERYFGTAEDRSGEKVGPHPSWGSFLEVLSEETRETLWQRFGEGLQQFGYHQSELGACAVTGGAALSRIN